MNNKIPFLPTISISLIVIHLHYLFIFTVRKKHIKCWLNWNWNPILRFIYLPSPEAITITLVWNGWYRKQTKEWTKRKEIAKKKLYEKIPSQKESVRERFLIVPFCTILSKKGLSSYYRYTCRFYLVCANVLVIRFNCCSIPSAKPVWCVYIRMSCFTEQYVCVYRCRISIVCLFTATFFLQLGKLTIWSKENKRNNHGPFTILFFSSGDFPNARW